METIFASQQHLNLLLGKTLLKNGLGRESFVKVEHVYHLFLGKKSS